MILNIQKHTQRHWIRMNGHSTYTRTHTDNESSVFFAAIVHDRNV